MAKHHSTELGFTLIELLVVISIIAVLSSIIMASLSQARSKAALAVAVEFDATNFRAFGYNAIAHLNFDQATPYPQIDQTQFPNLAVSIGSYYVPVGGGDCTNGIGSSGCSDSYSSDTPSGEGHSLDLGGNNSYFITLPQPFTFSNGYTISVWLKPYPSANSQIFLVSMTCESCVGGNNNNTGKIFIGSQPITTLYVGVSSNPVEVSNVDLPVNQWSLVTLSYDGTPSSGTFSVYINGHELPQSDLSCPDGDCTSLPFDGEIDSIQFGEGFVGEIDNVSIYPDPLE